MKIIEQLNLWVDGKSVHNDEREECCPDFSCCNKKVSTPKEVKELFRIAYLKDNQVVIERMLMEFLGNAFSNENVYIAGLDASRHEVESDIEL